MLSQLLTPQGIRFFCTGCGHCCHEYPVPLTSADVSRLEAVEPGLAKTAISLLSEAEKGQSGLAGFSYSLDKNSGTCAFLSNEKLCTVQDTAKPAMCQLFPYTFLHCPDGPRLGLSFASSGVLYNSGPLLAEQDALLANTYKLFTALHPGLEATSLGLWSKAQYVDGATLVYDHFLLFEKHYLARLSHLLDVYRSGLVVDSDGPTVADDALNILADMSASMHQSLPADVQNPLTRRFGHLEAEKLDQYFLMPFFFAYIAGKGQAGGDELITLAVMTYLQKEDRDLFFVVGERKVTFAELGAVDIGPYSPAENDLVNRFVYVKLFARLYFGPGFSMLPLLSGIFHLSMLLVLTRLALKIDALAGITYSSEERFERLAGLVREIDRRLTATQLSGNTAAMIELFALDPERLERFRRLAG